MPHTAVALTDLESASAIADAVLYEGYVLYPYRRSSQKNRVRWQFGVLAARSWLAVRGPLDETNVAGSVESWFQQTEFLYDGPTSATLSVRLRFLQLQAKAVERRTEHGYEPVDSLCVEGQQHLTFDEAVPREYDFSATVADLLAGEQRLPVASPAAECADRLPGGVGRVVRRTWPVSGVLAVSAYAAETPFPAIRIRVRVENTDDSTPEHVTREQALRRAMIATHTLVAVDGGELLSALDPPEWAAAAVRACRNVHTFPVRVGPPKTSRTMLSSPIILYDYVQVAPESPGDLHDGGEIDEILSLRTLTLTDEEKAEARATDPRTAAIVDRIDAMPPEMLDKLHGAVRSLQRIPAQPESVLVDGMRVTVGSRVRLRPRRHGTDAQDMFLAGRTARVDDILLDVDGTRFVAVTLDDDPGGETLGWYGRHYQFTVDEIEALS